MAPINSTGSRELRGLTINRNIRGTKNLNRWVQWNTKAMHHWLFMVGTHWWSMNAFHKVSVMMKSFRCPDAIICVIFWVFGYILRSRGVLTMKSRSTWDIVITKLCVKVNNNPSNVFRIIRPKQNQSGESQFGASMIIYACFIIVHAAAAC